MCGRFSLAISKRDIERSLMDSFELTDSVLLKLPRYNIAPRQILQGLVNNGEEIKLRDFVWGFIPSFGVKPSSKLELINVRIESLDDKWFLKEAVKQRRCLILADGFYEWEPTDQGKIPYRITLKEHEVFYFAGVYSQYSVLDNHLPTCAVITKEATNVMKGIHQRMPVMMNAKNAQRYLLDGILRDDMFIKDDELLMYPVSRLVNNVSIDKVECIREETPIRLEI